jgi:hypothetical protein
VFVGLARNCGHALDRLLASVAAVGEDLTDWSYVFLESDSYDDTLEVLRRFDDRHRGGIVRSYGNLKGRYPARTERLAFLRNACLRLVEDQGGLERFDLYVVLDMDAVNAQLEPERLLAVLYETDRDWAGVFANQRMRYYDIWALRHEEWCPDDWMARVRNRPAGMSRKQAEQEFLEARRIRIPEDAEPIEVDSAFGGLGIYDTGYIAGCSYRGVGDDGESVCEHVSFNTQIRAKGGRLFIRPSLINGTGVERHKAPGLRRLRYWITSRLPVEERT